jgi:hypothetical protein
VHSNHDTKPDTHVGGRSAVVCRQSRGAAFKEKAAEQGGALGILS